MHASGMPGEMAVTTVFWSRNLAALHDMDVVGVRESGTGGPWKHHIVVSGRSACAGLPVIAETLKPAEEVFEWNRCGRRACRIRWPD